MLNVADSSVGDLEFRFLGKLSMELPVFGNEDKKSQSILDF